MSDAPDICIYHGNCADGFTSAWAVWKRWPDIEFFPGVYGEPAPDVTGKNVLMVDFSYKRPVLEAMLETARTVTILDHHKTAMADLDGLGKYPNADITFDMDRSGAMITWEYVHDEPAPKIVQYVQDRDLWRFTLPGCRDFAAYLFSFEYEFDAWDEIAEAIEHPSSLAHCIASGAAIERKHHKDIAELLKISTREMIIGGHRVKVANLPYTMSSDAANALAEGQPFGACYFDRADARVFSLRSKADGLDVADIAATYGGGGHARAAGFQRPIGWEGDGSEAVHEGKLRAEPGPPLATVEADHV
jgi:oligoribonuclease NrnB/cAMP/cGMP phosphodiesterase (DHH superfamily)